MDRYNPPGMPQFIMDQVDQRGAEVLASPCGGQFTPDYCTCRLGEEDRIMPPYNWRQMMRCLPHKCHCPDGWVIDISVEARKRMGDGTFAAGIGGAPG